MKQIQTAVNLTAQPLVEVRENQTVTTSLQIAKLFNKNHFDVLKAIRELDCSSKFIHCNFAVYHYLSKLNKNVTRKLPMYYITRDGFTFLAMGFTGKEASKFKEAYISAFNQMEQRLREIERKGFEKMHRKVDTSLKPKHLYKLTDEYYNCIIDSVERWIECENRDCYAPSIRDNKLIARLEATRLIYFDRNQEVPFLVSMSIGRIL